MMRQCILLPCLFTAILGAGPGAGAQTAGGIPPSDGGASPGAWKEVPELTEAFRPNGVGESLSPFGRTCREQAAAMEIVRRQILQAVAGLGPPKGIGENNRKLGKRSGDLKNVNAKAAAWSRKLGDFLEAVNVAAAFAQDRGRSNEGEGAGRGSLLVDEGAMKAAAGLAGAVGSIVPGVGCMAGETLGEFVHETSTQPILELNAGAVPAREPEEGNTGPEIQGERIISWDGSIRTLSPDLYPDPGTGYIKKRTPEEQKAYEEKFREETRKTAASNHPMDRSARDLKEGKSEQSRVDGVGGDFNKPAEEEHQQGKPEPAAGMAEGGEAMPDTGISGRAACGQEETKPAPGEEKGPSTPPTQGSVEILKSIQPMQVTASAVYEEDFSSADFKNILTTTVTVSFWNVGALTTGYDGAVCTKQAVSSLHRTEEVTRCSGTFAGGPDGTFTFVCEGSTLQLRLQGGEMIRMGELTLRVHEPEAFADWP